MQSGLGVHGAESVVARRMALLAETVSTVIELHLMSAGIIDCMSS